MRYFSKKEKNYSGCGKGSESKLSFPTGSDALWQIHASWYLHTNNFILNKSETSVRLERAGAPTN